MEMREVFLRNGAPTGRIVEKHAQGQSGEYFRHAIVIMRVPDGRYVLQQRSLKARWYPGKWDVTGGGVAAGETPAQAAMREAYEELGVRIDPEGMRHVFSYITDWEDGSGGLLVDMFFAQVNIPAEGFDVDRYEVNDVRLASYEDFAAAIRFNKTDEFMEAVAAIEKEM